jgi:hypothetical protein
MPAKEGAKYLPRTEALPDSSGKWVTKIFVAPERVAFLARSSRKAFPASSGIIRTH